MDKYQIFELIRNNSIEVADFTNAVLNDDDCLKLSNIIENNNSVSKLIIRNKNFNEEALLKKLQYNKAFLINNYNEYIKYKKEDDLIKYLNNNCCNQITIGYNYIFDALKNNNCIKTLVLDNVIFNDRNFYFFSEMLKSNKSIQKLDLNIDCNENYKETRDCYKLFCDSLLIHNNLTSFKINFSNIIYSPKIRIISPSMIFDSLTTNTNLKKLSINNHFLNSDNIESFIKLLDNHKILSKLTLRKLNFFDDVSLIKTIFDYIENLKDLTYLNLKKSKGIKNEFIISLLNKNKNIKYLNLNYTNEINNYIYPLSEYRNYRLYSKYHYNTNYDDLINVLLDYNVNTLKVAGLYYLTSDNIIKLLTYNKHIINLDINGQTGKEYGYCYNRLKKDDEILKLIKYFQTNTTLQTLNMNNFNIKSDLILNEFNQMLLTNKTLTKLNINNCFTFKDTYIIFNTLQHNNTLQKIWIYPDIIHNKIHINETDNYINHLCNLIQNNKTLTQIKLDTCIEKVSNYFVDDSLKLNNINISFYLINNDQFNKIKKTLQSNNPLINIISYNIFLRQLENKYFFINN